MILSAPEVKEIIVMGEGNQIVAVGSYAQLREQGWLSSLEDNGAPAEENVVLAAQPIPTRPSAGGPRSPLLSASPTNRRLRALDLDTSRLSINSIEGSHAGRSTGRDRAFSFAAFNEAEVRWRGVVSVCC
jgi:hypothetical protein